MSGCQDTSDLPLAIGFSRLILNEISSSVGTFRTHECTFKVVMAFNGTQQCIKFNKTYKR
jgi:hypothetical protein